MQHSQKGFLESARLSKVMWSLSLPAIAAMVLFGLNAFMDTVYIGQLLNETALAGVALAYPLTSIMLGLGSWAGTGAGNLLSIAIGKEDTETQEKLLGNATIFILISSLLFTLPGFFAAEPFIRMMGGTGEVLEYGVEYFRIAMIGAPFWVYGLSLNFIVRGEGKMKQAAIMMSYGLGLNLVLSPLFMGVFNMGIAGAAWGTNLGMMVYCIVGYRYFKRGKASFPTKIDSLAYDKSVFSSITKLGFPGFIMSMMGLIQAIVVFNAIVRVGTENDLAFFAAANRIQLFLMTPLFGLMRALQPVVGVNYGAAKYGRVKKAYNLFTRTGFFIIFPFWVFMMIFPELSLRLVLPNMAFSGTDIFHFRIYMIMLPVLPVVFMSLTFLPAIEKPKFASLIGMARQLIFYVPVMWFLPGILGMKGIYYGATGIDLVVTLFLVAAVWWEMRQMGKVGPPKEEVELSSVNPG